MSLTEEFYTLKNNIDLLEKEIQQLSGGRKASASRSRKCLQNIKKQSFDMRKNITTHVKALPTKKRVPKVAEKTVEPVEPEKSVEAVEPPSDLTKSDKVEPEKKPRKAKERQRGRRDKERERERARE